MNALPAKPKEDRSIIRCKCGVTVNITWPTKCPGCGDIKAYWKTIDGKILRLSEMTLGHLTSTIKLISEKSAEAFSKSQEIFETTLDLLYEELGSRDKEIDQASGILAALNRSLAK